MATLPLDDEPTPTPVQRVTRAVVQPIQHNHVAALLAVAAGAGSTAPLPFGVIVAMTCVMAAFGIAKRK